MRIISQDGLTDIPYEKCVLEVVIYQTGITINFGMDEYTGFLGTYKTVDDAKKVLEMIRIHESNGHDWFMMPLEEFGQ